MFRRLDDAKSNFTLPSYVGNKSGGEAICCLAAIVSGSLVGADQTNPDALNRLRACQEWFSESLGVVVNNVGSKNPGGSFWYVVLPGVLFTQIAIQYPEDSGLDAKLHRMADRYTEAVIALGGPDANFNHRGFDFSKNEPLDAGKVFEPDAAAGIAYIEYAAWKRWHDPKHLEAARWCLDFLERRKPDEGSPLYETLLYYAPALAAQMNAEHGTHYDVVKLLNWCLGDNRTPRGARPNWGVIARNFGDVEVYGLQGSTREGDGYAFAMNTFNAAGALAPLVRYVPEFAKPIAKWLTNVAINSRLFFPDEVPANKQSNPEIRAGVLHCVPYEGLREKCRTLLQWRFAGTARGSADAGIDLLKAKEGNFRCDDHGMLSAAFEVALPASFVSGSWRIEGRVAHAGSLFHVRTGSTSNGPWKSAGGFPGSAPEGDGHFIAGGPLPPGNATGSLWLKIEAAGHHDPGESLALRAPEFRGTLSICPWSSGDNFTDGKGATDLAVYGGAYIGYLGTVVRSPEQDGVMTFDLSATDFLGNRDSKDLLCYNATSTPRDLTLRNDLVIHLDPFEASLIHSR